MATGEFLYSLVLPGDPGYQELDALLTAHWQGRADRKRRVRFSVDDVRSAWPSSPLWSVALPALYARFPKLDLAVPPAELRNKPVVTQNDLYELPVRLDG